VSKQVQIPVTLLIDVYKLLVALEDETVAASTVEIAKRVKTQIDDKIKAMDKRKTFTEYKTAAVASDEREQKRKEYLEKAGIHPDWQSTNEMHS